MGALRPTSNKGELSAFFMTYAGSTLLDPLSRPPGSTTSRSFNILTDSKISVRLFADSQYKGRCNKVLMQRVRRGLALLKRSDKLSVG